MKKILLLIGKVSLSLVLLTVLLGVTVLCSMIGSMALSTIFNFDSRDTTLYFFMAFSPAAIYIAYLFSKEHW